MTIRENLKDVCKEIVNQINENNKVDNGTMELLIKHIGWFDMYADDLIRQFVSINSNIGHGGIPVIKHLIEYLSSNELKEV